MQEFDAKSIWAKSDGKSLIRHLEDCLTVYREVAQALPIIPHLVKLDNFFDLLFCAVYMHDWGKVHIEFQNILKKKNNQWHNNRHEIFSVPFVEMLKLPIEHKELIAQAILGHHKSFETLLHYLYSDEEIEDYHRNFSLEVNPLDFKENLSHRLDVSYLKALKTKFQFFYNRYASGNYRFEFKNVDFESQLNPIKIIVKPFLSKNFQSSGEKYWRQMFLSGCVKLCDHMGSAEISEIPKLSGSHFEFLGRLNGKCYAHQKECADVEGNVILSSPTGSGKTEAALLWIKKQFQTGHQGRIFYILPYTASINAMHQRLINDFEKKGTKPGRTRYIGILHGKIAQYISEFYESSDETFPKKKSQISKLKEIHRQMIHPLKVVTPFQILKYCYGVKGFEMGFSELAGAMLIFDEIHAYDTQTFAQIVASLNWMTRSLHIRVMIMTATLPSFMLNELHSVLGSLQTIKADDDLLEQFTRHRVIINEGNIFDQLSAIRKAIHERRRVIIVCNTVSNAQKIFNKLRNNVGDQKAVLLHSRFTFEDRLAKERILLEEEKVCLLVGTQAIEVSLDLDFDIMFTEPAPLDALIQRFGRINRKRKKRICPVIVCLEAGEKDQYIYPKTIVKNTLDVLKDITVIKEKEIKRMLDKVYPDWPEKEKYYEVKKGFTESLSRLKPYMQYQEEEKYFYKRFTGLTVIPIELQDEYEERLRRCDFIEAEKLGITIHQGIFFRLFTNGLVEKTAGVIEKNSQLKSVSYWLAKCKYDSNLGLLEEEPLIDGGVRSF